MAFFLPAASGKAKREHCCQIFIEPYRFLLPHNYYLNSKISFLLIYVINF